MKIVMIHGQNHKGSTYHIGKILADKLTSEQELTEFFLPRDLNHHCLGCYACLENEAACPFFEEKSVIAEAMERAELLIFTTPTYCMAPSAPMKAFIDLFFQYWLPHRPRKSMFSKKAVVISTAAGSGAGQAVRQVKKTLAYWGVPYVKTYALAVQASNWSEVQNAKKEKIGRDMTALAKRLRKAKTGKPSPYIRFLFSLMANGKKQNPDHMAAESAYWQENGWLDGAKPWKKQKEKITEP